LYQSVILELVLEVVFPIVFVASAVFVVVHPKRMHKSDMIKTVLKSLFFIVLLMIKL